jgi:hypothetical protein
LSLRTSDGKPFSKTRKIKKEILGNCYFHFNIGFFFLKAKTLSSKSSEEATTPKPSRSKASAEAELMSAPLLIKGLGGAPHRGDCDDVAKSLATHGRESLV